MGNWLTQVHLEGRLVNKCVCVCGLVLTLMFAAFVMNKLVRLMTGPSSEDLESFVSYLIQLIHGCDLEHVGLLLKYVQRFVSFSFFMTNADSSYYCSKQ